MKNIVGSPFHTTCELSSCRQEKSEECCMGENLARVCAPPHREHPCEHSANQCIKSRSRCSNPRANFLCIAIGSKAMASVGENLAKVCAPPHREHPLEHPAFQRVKCRFRCSHPRAKFVCRAMWSSAKASVGENLVKVCAPPHREHPSEHPAVQRVKCRFRCSHPQAKLRRSLALNRQPTLPIRRICPIITPSRRARRKKSSSFGPLKRKITESKKIRKKSQKNIIRQRAAQ